MPYLLILVFIAWAGFYAGVETGVYCLNRVRLRWRVSQGWRSARVLDSLLATPRRLISTTLVGHNLGVYIASVLLTGLLFARGLGTNSGLVATLILSPFLLVLAEAAPKTIFERKADTFLYRLAPLVHFSFLLFLPATVILRGISVLVECVLGRRGREGNPVFDPRHLPYFLAEGREEGILSSYQKQMADRIMKLDYSSVERAMVPLEKVAMIPEGISHEDFLDFAREKQFSRFPVFAEENRERIVGVVHILDVISEGRKQEGVTTLARRPQFVKADTPIDEALAQLGRARRPLGVITGPEGKAIGIVTLQGLVEEVVGDLESGGK